MLRRSVFLIGVLVMVLPLKGQLNNRVFEDRMVVNEGDSGKFFAGVNALGFFKNNEYVKTIVDGYTLFGYQFQPYVSYNLNKHIRIDAGGYFQKDFGNNSFSTTAPVFSIKWRNKEYAIIFGNLEGSLNHRLIEPLYDFERVLTNRLETGVQLQLNREDFFVDAWIDWQYMQYWSDNRQEQLVGGLSLQKQVLKKGDAVWSIPVQLIGRHQGGQLDTAHLPIQTIVNSAVGIDFRLNRRGWIKQLGVNGFYVYDKDLTGARQAYKDGDGWYVNGSMATKFGLNVMASYWKGKEFMSFEGGKIYPSVGYYDPTRIQPAPDLIILRFLYDYRITDQLYLTLRYEPYFDLSFNSFQYSYAIYINYRDRFKLTR